MAKNNKKVWMSVSALVVVAALALIFGLATNHAEKTSTVSAHHETKAEKTVVKENTIDKADVKNAKENEEEQPKSREVKTNQVKTKKVEAKKETQAPTFTMLSKPVTKYVNVSSLNVRSGAGTNHSVVTVVTKGQAVTITELSSNGWSKVHVTNKTGWVSSKYLVSTKPIVHRPATHSTASTTTHSSTTSQSATRGNVADHLKTVSANRQLILVTTSGYGTSVAIIRTFERDSNGKWKPVLSVSGHVGKYGLTSNMREGAKKSPIGKFTIGTAFGRYANPGTKMPYRRITSDDVWVDDPTSKLYNTWQSRSKTQGQWNSAENMNIPAYNYGFVINYNTARIPYKGSAIFFHVGSGYTLGCTDTAQSNVVKILRWLDPAKNPVIIQTPVSGLGNF